MDSYKTFYKYANPAFPGKNPMFYSIILLIDAFVPHFKNNFIKQIHILILEFGTDLFVNGQG